jgi:hypothetical protein
VSTESTPVVFGSTAQGDDRAQRIAALSHDVRAPLQVLGLSLQALRLRAHEPEDQELVFAAESAFEEIAGITDDLIDSLRFGVSGEPPREEESHFRTCCMSSSVGFAAEPLNSRLD